MLVGAAAEKAFDQVESDRVMGDEKDPRDYPTSTHEHFKGTRLVRLDHKVDFPNVIGQPVFSNDPYDEKGWLRGSGWFAENLREL